MANYHDVTMGYIPYGPEWEKELRKFNKKMLIDMIRSLAKENTSSSMAILKLNIMAGKWDKNEVTGVELIGELKSILKQLKE